MNSTELTDARALIDSSRHIVVLTGAGISTASGIPDFRGPEGVWTKDPDAEMLSSFDTWITRRDVRERAWASRLERRFAPVEPNRGHFAVVALEKRGTIDLVITQNIDGLHQRAGTSRERLVEIHGTSSDVRCLTCDYRASIDDLYPRLEAGDLDPHCIASVNGAVCNGLLKSAVISFGQPLVASDLERCHVAARAADLIVCIGTTLAVFPAAGVVPLAARHGAHVVIINGEPTEMDSLATVIVRGDISEALTALTSS